jgi:hypothetical protein
LNQGALQRKVSPFCTLLRAARVAGQYATEIVCLSNTSGVMPLQTHTPGVFACTRFTQKWAVHDNCLAPHEGPTRRMNISTLCEDRQPPCCQGSSRSAFWKPPSMTNLCRPTPPLRKLALLSRYQQVCLHFDFPKQKLRHKHTFRQDAVSGASLLNLKP